MTRAEAEKAGWTFSLVGDTFHGSKVGRPSASKRFPLGVKECTGIDESQVLAPIVATEASETQRLANEALAASRAAQELRDEAGGLEGSAV